MDQARIDEIRKRPNDFSNGRVVIELLDEIEAQAKEIARLEKAKKELDFTKGTLVQYSGENKWGWDANDVLGIISHTHFDEEELKAAIAAQALEEKA